MAEKMKVAPVKVQTKGNDVFDTAEARKEIEARRQRDFEFLRRMMQENRSFDECAGVMASCLATDSLLRRIEAVEKTVALFQGGRFKMF